MPTVQFLNKDNVSMLWDVIVDEDIFKFLSKDMQNSVSQVFMNNLKGFYDIEKLKSGNLVEINKKYIMLILNYIKTNFSQQIPAKIKIHEEKQLDKKELITFEDLQNDRKSQFEKDLIKRQEEFTDAITLRVPDEPNFREKINDEPIKEMESLIKDMMAQRKYDIMQINNHQEDGSWLKSQETSVKTEKLQYNTTSDNSNINTTTNSNANKLKHIKLDNDTLKQETKEHMMHSWESQEMISTQQLNTQPKKMVSWTNKDAYIDDTDIQESYTLETNLFNKLKKIPSLKDEKKDEKIAYLEEEIKSLNTKMDMIIDLLKNKN